MSLVVLEVKLKYIQAFGKALFGLYNVAARILLLNMLIAMMAKSFHTIVVRYAEAISDRIIKARSKEQLDRAIAAAFAAIEVYNKPDFD